jgi:hypothetical protein
MSNDTKIDYGKLTKQVVFTENDHRHAQLLIRLKHDGFTQAAFFREIITGYILGDERIVNYVDDVKSQSQEKKRKSRKLRAKGKTAVEDLGLSEQQLVDIFDIIAEEHPEL